MNLLITGAWQYSDSQIEQLKSLGYSIIFMPDEKGMLPCDYEWANVIICNGLFLYHPIEKFKSLKHIQLVSAGYDRLPMDAADSMGICVYNAKGVYSIPMAEFAVMAALDIYKNRLFFAKGQEDKFWKKNRDLLELYSKTVCIVGCGSVGTECAKRFRAFGCKVIGVEISETHNESYDKIYAVEELKTAVSISDIVVLSVPLTQKTYHLIDSDVLSQLKNGAVLINIARGGIIDTRALIDHLRQNRIFAALDVYEEEPLTSDDPLWNMSNVSIYPHNSFVGDGNADRLWRIIISNLENIT